MHEYGLMADVVDVALKACPSQTGLDPVCVRVQVGEFAFASRESLTTAFEILPRGTRLEGARLELEEVSGRARCEACRFEGSAADVGPGDSDPPALFLCPRCGSPLLVTAGAGLTLTEVQLQDRGVPGMHSSEAGGR